MFEVKKDIIQTLEKELYYMETYQLQILEKLVDSELLRRKIYKYDKGTNYETGTMIRINSTQKRLSDFDEQKE